jgi:hypothetical protein
MVRGYVDKGYVDKGYVDKGYVDKGYVVGPRLPSTSLRFADCISFPPFSWLRYNLYFLKDYPVKQLNITAAAPI